MVDYVLYSLTHNRGFFYDAHTAYNNAYPVFKSRNIIIDHQFITDMITLSLMYDKILLTYGTNTPQFLKAIKDHIILDKIPNQSSQVVLFYNLVKKIVNDLNPKEARSSMIVKSVNMNKDLIILIVKYDTYFFDKVEKVIITNSDTTSIVTLFDGRVTVGSNDDIKIFDPESSIPDSDDYGGQLIALPNNLLIGISAYEGRYTLYDTQRGATLYTDDTVSLTLHKLGIFPDGKIIVPERDAMLQIIDREKITLFEWNRQNDKDEDEEEGIQISSICVLTNDLVIISFDSVYPPEVYNIKEQKTQFLLGDEVTAVDQFLVSKDLIFGIVHSWFRIWDYKGQLLYKVNAHDQKIEHALLFNDQLITCQYRGLKIWDLDKEVFSLSFPGIRKLKVYMDSDLIFLTNKNLYMLNLKTKNLRILQESDICDFTIQGTKIVIVDYDGNVTFLY